MGTSEDGFGYHAEDEDKVCLSSCCRCIPRFSNISWCALFAFGFVASLVIPASECINHYAVNGFWTFLTPTDHTGRHCDPDEVHWRDGGGHSRGYCLPGPDYQWDDKDPNMKGRRLLSEWRSRIREATSGSAKKPAKGFRMPFGLNHDKNPCPLWSAADQATGNRVPYRFALPKSRRTWKNPKFSIDSPWAGSSIPAGNDGATASSEPTKMEDFDIVPVYRPSRITNALAPLKNVCMRVKPLRAPKFCTLRAEYKAWCKGPNGEFIQSNTASSTSPEGSGRDRTESTGQKDEGKPIYYEHSGGGRERVPVLCYAGYELTQHDVFAVYASKTPKTSTSSAASSSAASSSEPSSGDGYHEKMDMNLMNWSYLPARRDEGEATETVAAQSIREQARGKQVPGHQVQANGKHGAAKAKDNLSPLLPPWLNESHLLTKNSKKKACYPDHEACADDPDPDLDSEDLGPLSLLVDIGELHEYYWRHADPELIKDHSMKPPFPIGLSEEQRNLYCQPNADVEEEGTFVFTDLVIELNTLFFKLLDPLQAHGMKIVTLGTALALGTNMALVTFLSPFLFLVLLSLVVVTVLLYVFFNFGFLYVTGFLGPLLAAPVKPPIVPSPGTEEMLRGTDTQQLQGPPHELAGKNNGVHFCYPTELQRTMTSSLTSTNQELHQQNQDDLPRKVQNFMNGLHIFYCKNLCVTWDSEAVLVAVCLVIFLFTTMILLRVIKYRHSAGLALQLLMASTKVLWKVPGLLFFAPVCAIFTGVGCMFLYGCCLGAVFVVPDEYFCNGLVFGVLSGLLRLVLVPVQMILPAEVTSILFTSTQSSGTCSSIAYNSSPFTSTDVAAAHVASWVLRWIAAGLTIGMYEWFRSFMHGTTTTAVADAVVCWFYTYDDGENDEDKDDGNYGVEDDRSKDAKIFDDETDGDLELELEDLQQENGHHVAPCEYHGHEDDKNDDEQDNQGPLTAETQRLLRLRNESHGVDEEEEEAVVVNVSKSPREACHRAESPTSTKRSTPRSEHRDHHGCYEAEEQVPCLVESATASEDGEPDRGIHDHCEDEEPLIMEEERSGKRNDKWVEGQHRVSLVTTAGSEEIQGRDDNVTLECDEADGREVVVLDKPRGPKSRTCLFSGTTTKSTTSKKCGAAPRHLIWRFFIAPFGFLILWVRVLFRFSGAIAMGAFFHSFYRLIQFVAGFDWTGTSKTHFILLALAVVPISKIYVYMALDNQTSFSGACRTALGVLSRHPSQWLMLEAITHSLSFICYTGVFVVVLIASLVTHPDAAAQTNVTRYLQKTAESGPCLVNEVLLQMRFPFASEDYACDAKSGSSSAGSSTSTSAAGGAPGAAAAGTAGNQGNINHGNGSWGSPGAVISGGVAQVAQAEQGNNAKEKDEKGKETKERQKDWRGWLQLLSRRGRSDTWVYPLLNLVIALFFTHEILKVYGIAVDALYVCCLRDWDEHGQKLSNTSRLRQLKMLKLQKAFRRVFAQERRGRFS